MLTRRSFVVGVGAGLLAAKDTRIEALQTRVRELKAVKPQPCDGRVKVDLWMLPQATGDGSGSSPENAKGTDALASVVAPGRHIGLLADKGDWPGFSCSFAAGGADDSPCVIQGVDQARRPTQVVISSSRPRPVLDGWDPEWGRGRIGGGHDVFRLKRGADYLSFRHLHFRNTDRTFQVLGTVHGLELDTIDFTNVREGLWMDNDLEPDGLKRAIRGFTARRIRAIGFEESIFRLYGDTEDALIEGIEADSQRMQGHITVGLSIGKGDSSRTDTVHNVRVIGAAFGYSGVIQNCHDQHYEKPWLAYERDADGKVIYKTNGDGSYVLDKQGNKVPRVSARFYAPVDSDGYKPIKSTTVIDKDPAKWRKDGLPGTKYWQGDAVTSGRLCWGIVLEKLTLRGCTDGGVDLKSMDTQIVDCVFEDNKRNMRLWGLSTPEHPDGIRIIAGASRSARKRGGNGGMAHIYITGGETARDQGPQIHLDGFTFEGAPAAAFHINKERPHGVNVTHENCSFNGRNPVPVLGG
jgi:hypothetical protein